MVTSEEWKGRTGQEWARRADALDRLLGPAGRAGIAALAPVPGERVLDLGCGAGASTAELAPRVLPGGKVTAIDVSADLLAAARQRLGDMDGVEVIEANAEQHAFADGSFDALYSRFGSMFFDDPAAAFDGLRGAVRPGGRAVFVAWREAARNQWASVPMTFVTEGTTAPGPTPGPGPFGWADEGVFRPLLEAAGFTGVTAEAMEYMAEISDGDDPDPVVRAVTFMSRIGPLAARLKGASEDARREAQAFLAKRLERHVHDGAVRLLASAWIIRAQV